MTTIFVSISFAPTTTSTAFISSTSGAGNDVTSTTSSCWSFLDDTTMTMTVLDNAAMTTTIATLQWRSHDGVDGVSDCVVWAARLCCRRRRGAMRHDVLFFRLLKFFGSGKLRSLLGSGLVGPGGEAVCTLKPRLQVCCV